MSKLSILSRGDKIKLAIFLWMAILIGVFYSYSWWTQIYNSPSNVFWGMIDNSLSTASVTKHMTQKTDDQSLDRISYIRFGAVNASHTFETRQQDTGYNNSQVKEEIISTPQTDYVRFNEVKSDATLPGGKAPDYSKIIGIWGKSEKETSKGEFTGKNFAVTAFGTIPVVKLSHENRKILTSRMKITSVYEVDFAHVSKITKGMRTEYTYHVTINPAAYFNMISKLSLMLGINVDAQLVSKNTSDEVPDVAVDVTVDANSRQLVKMHYSATNIDETYGSYGVLSDVEIPTKTISLSELQSRIQKI